MLVKLRKKYVNMNVKIFLIIEMEKCGTCEFKERYIFLTLNMLKLKRFKNVMLVKLRKKYVNMNVKIFLIIEMEKCGTCEFKERYIFLTLNMLKLQRFKNVVLVKLKKKIYFVNVKLFQFIENTASTKVAYIENDINIMYMLLFVEAVFFFIMVKIFFLVCTLSDRQNGKIKIYVLKKSRFRSNIYIYIFFQQWLKCFNSMYFIEKIGWKNRHISQKKVILEVVLYSCYQLK
eukprot:TRINITY_DN3324_c1_g2_i8.p3 TRINITY_DN3324_c1_g2~~TRINITY_DN3324_c1_g2_i8.p3  ORF type:complete len:232 (+),score=2.57 TRINITY_DN3324_c1_g2_i8:226-921(+)